MHDFAFAEPRRLWLLAVFAAVVIAGFLVRRTLSRRAEPFAQPAMMPSVLPHRAGWRRPVAVLGIALAAVTLTTAFARPQVLAKHAHARAVVVVALDTSSSMLATDVTPDRFTAAKVAAKAFIRELPAQIDVGLVAYNATAVLVAAPTAQHEQVATAIDGLGLSGGTAMGDALQASLAAVLRGAAASDNPAARIVLLSDGGSTAGSPLDDAVSAAAAAHVPVSTIAYGTADGVVISNGHTFPVPVDTATLAAIASATGGTAYRAASAADLRSVYSDIGTQLVTDTARSDIADGFAGVALLLLLGTALPSLAWFARLA
ncbi:MAG: Ca-activated chloride channel [Actinomycetota bacterium]|jgi:Ca-activated chloride channel family protein|nr:Ca-activated chloride channel [Actinomycetota bacterium]